MSILFGAEAVIITDKLFIFPLGALLYCFTGLVSLFRVASWSVLPPTSSGQFFLEHAKQG